MSSARRHRRPEMQPIWADRPEVTAGSQWISRRQAVDDQEVPATACAEEVIDRMPRLDGIRSSSKS
jgi:hypothetical protein